MSDIKAAVRAVAVTPSDSAPNGFRALYVGASGDLTVILQGDSSPVTFKNAPVGYHPLSTSKVMSTGTAASQIVGLL